MFFKKVSRETNNKITLETDFETPEGIARAELQTNILSEMEIAQAGKRILAKLPGEKIEEGKFIAQKSTFPKWIPEELRKKDRGRLFSSLGANGWRCPLLPLR